MTPSSRHRDNTPRAQRRDEVTDRDTTAGRQAIAGRKAIAGCQAIAGREAYEVGGWSVERWTRDTRYYEIRTHQDLWGEWVVTRVNGRAGEALGRVVHEPACDRSAALAVARRLATRRRRRGYGRVTVLGRAAVIKESVGKRC